MVARAARGRLAARDARRRDPAHAVAGRPRRPPGRRRARVRARPRARPPRHQAREPPLRRARHRAGRRLRARPRAGRGELDRARRHGARHRALRVAGAGHRGPARRPRRPLRARPRAGRVGHRQRPARRRDAARHARRMRNEQSISRAGRSWARSGPVIERAGQVDPDDRYPDAPTMGAALDDVDPRAAAAGSVHARRARRGGARPAPDAGRHARATGVRPGRDARRSRSRSRPAPPRRTPSAAASVAPVRPRRWCSSSSSRPRCSR